VTMYHTLIACYCVRWAVLLLCAAVALCQATSEWVATPAAPADADATTVFVALRQRNVDKLYGMVMNVSSPRRCVPASVCRRCALCVWFADPPTVLSSALCRPRLYVDAARTTAAT
jgi:hypothetical protein